MKKVTKTYGHDLGLSATFRQWRAESHCRFMHGYALGVKLTFVCENHQVDRNGWVINFGGLKPLKKWLEETFDHKTLVAEDDPNLEEFVILHDMELIQMVTVKGIGCEAFAEMIFKRAHAMLMNGELGETEAKLVEVEVREHGANAAIFSPDPVPHTELRITNGATSQLELEEMIRRNVTKQMNLREQSRARTGV